MSYQRFIAVKQDYIGKTRCSMKFTQSRVYCSVPCFSHVQSLITSCEGMKKWDALCMLSHVDPYHYGLKNIAQGSGERLI